MGDTEMTLLKNAFDSNWIAPVGDQIDLFENEVAQFTNREFALAVNSGTSALHLALIALGIGENDVVLCPSLTFSASCNIIIYQNAIPVFLDVDTKSWTLDIDTLNVAVKKYKPKALIAVDLYGQICNYDEIYNICKKNGVFIVEDSAESLGSMYKNEKAGSFGDISIFSFNGNKIITTSGGGMLLTDNKEFFDKAKLIANQAKENRHYYHHKHLGYNYRLSN